MSGEETLTFTAWHCLSEVVKKQRAARRWCDGPAKRMRTPEEEASSHYKAERATVNTGKTIPVTGWVVSYWTINPRLVSM